MAPDTSGERPRALAAGAGAGAVLALADWAASGLAATPARLVAVTLLAGLLAGASAGVIAALSGKRLAAVGLVVAGGLALEGLSTASKELEGGSRLAAGALVLALALLTSILCAARERVPQRTAWAWSALLAASVPAGALAAAWLTTDPWLHLAGPALPLLLLLLERATARRGPVLAAAGLLLALFGLAQPGRASPQERRERELAAPVPPPNGKSLVLLVIDTLRADEVPSDGPLAAFARNGVTFRQCVSAAPWTLPAVSSLLTGLLPSQHGALDATSALPADVTTLAERLGAQGYATAAFTGGAFVGASHRLDQGFEHFDATAEQRFAPSRLHAPLVWRLAKNRHVPLPWLARWVDGYRGFAGVVAAARAWGEERRRAGDERPLFLFLHTYQVHDYYLLDPSVDGERAGDPALSARFAGRSSVHPVELVQAAQGDLDAFRARYRGRVRAVEACLPELERCVRELAGEDVLWVITADHGEGFDAAHRRVHHGGRLHDDLLRVPLFLRAKGLSAGRVIEETVRSVDVLPTALDLLGLPVPEGLAGESLLPDLHGARALPRSAFAEERAQGFDLLALRRDGWKWIRAPSGAELYHVAEDPLETNPLEDEPPAELREEFATFPERFPARSSARAELDPATQAQLRALGYAF